MAAKHTSEEKGAIDLKGGDLMELAVNKTRGLAFMRRGDREDWQPIAVKEVGDLDEMERYSHTKIGDNWFSMYRPGDGKRYEISGAGSDRWMAPILPRQPSRHPVCATAAWSD